jgi:hypothetical protein
MCCSFEGVMIDLLNKKKLIVNIPRQPPGQQLAIQILKIKGYT